MHGPANTFSASPEIEAVLDEVTAILGLVPFDHKCSSFCSYAQPVTFPNCRDYTFPAHVTKTVFGTREQFNDCCDRAIRWRCPRRRFSICLRTLPLGYDLIAAGIAGAAYGTFFAMP
jgi:hypothetical protein